MKVKKKGSPLRISSLSNFNIRIADRVMIQWVRSTYFFFFFLGVFSDFRGDLFIIIPNNYNLLNK